MGLTYHFLNIPVYFVFLLFKNFQYPETDLILKVVCVMNACRFQLRSKLWLIAQKEVSACAYLGRWWGNLSRSPLVWRFEAFVRELTGREKIK